MISAPWRRQRRQQPGVTPPSGTACSVAGCLSLDAQVCSYRDRRGRTCSVSCCHPHSLAVADDYVQLTRNIVRRARWERSWRIVDNTGLVLKLSIYIDEGDDSLIHVRVGDVIVGEGVPPWIARRAQGEGVAATIDIAQRQQFYGSIEATIAGALEDRELFRRN